MQNYKTANLSCKDISQFMENMSMRETSYLWDLHLLIL